MGEMDGTKTCMYELTWLRTYWDGWMDGWIGIYYPPPNVCFGMMGKRNLLMGWIFLFLVFDGGVFRACDGWVFHCFSTNTNGQTRHFCRTLLRKSELNSQSNYWDQPEQRGKTRG